MHPVYNIYVATLNKFYKPEISFVKNVAKVKFYLHFEIGLKYVCASLIGINISEWDIYMYISKNECNT